MHNNLTRLRSMIIAEKLTTPRPVPNFRTIEFSVTKEEESQNESSMKESTNHNDYNHEEMLRDLKMLKQEKEDLTKSLMDLKNQLIEMENQNRKELEEKETAVIMYQQQNCIISPVRVDIEHHDSHLEVSRWEGQRPLNSDFLKEELNMINLTRESVECQTEFKQETNAEVDHFKMKAEQAEKKYSLLEVKLVAAEAELDSLRSEHEKWSKKCHSLEVKESQTQAELCEMSQLYEGLCALKLPDGDSDDALTDLRLRLKKSKAENCDIKLQLSTLQLQLQDTKHENEILQKCLHDSKKKIGELDVIVKQLKHNQHARNEHKEIQASQEIEFPKKLKALVNTLDIEEHKKQLFIKPLNQPCNPEKVVQHMKLVYGEFVTTSKYNKEQEKRLKNLETDYIELNKGKEKLEKRIQKLSEICKAFQGLSEVQEKEIRHFNETKSMLAEKTEKCEMLNRRIVELELLIAKTKERKNVFKKKYFKERHANKKKNRKKTDNWLSKIFDWRQISPA